MTDGWLIVWVLVVIFLATLIRSAFGFGEALVALHPLAPAFFPLWDEKIAKGYGCYYNVDPAGQYLAFFKLTQDIAKELAPSVNVSGKTLLKRIDEYNYAKFTKGWVE